MADEPVRAHLTVSGRVQGVSFRYSTHAEADALGLRGWVRNLADGRVELVAEGPEQAVTTLIEWCRKGPRFARVDGVNIAWEDPRGEPPGFRIV